MAGRAPWPQTCGEEYGLVSSLIDVSDPHTSLCHRSSVSGLTTNALQRARGSTLDSAARRARSFGM